MGLLHETVTLQVRISCVGCARAIEETQCPDVESLRTGNTTERADYWITAMRGRVLARAATRKWETGPGGFKCAHCIAAERDPLSGGTP